MLALALTACRPPAPAAPPRPPNVVIVLLDDLRWDEVDYPFVQAPNIDRLADEGVRFRNAFVTTPLCSPSRASLLTGQYAHAHGIVDNTDRSARSRELVTFPRLLHDAGYETAFLGKWHMGVDDGARPGFDRWVSVQGQGDYLDPTLNIDGERRQVPGYFTDVLDDLAVDFVAAPHDRPFLLLLAHKAVHPDVTQYADGSVSDPTAATFVPAERHRGWYADAEIPHRPNHGVPPLDKPALLRPIDGVPPLGPDTGTPDETVRNRLRMLAAVDEGLGRILAALEAAGTLDDTIVVFTSDEGYFYGEHGLSVERRLAYEESIRIPLLVRGPGIAAGQEVDAAALNIDLAPTVLELAGVPAPAVHGRSLVPWLHGQPIPWRASFLVEHHSDRVFPRMEHMGYRALRTEHHKLVAYTDLAGMDELYDLDADPYELHNVASDPAQADRIAALRAELDAAVAATP